MLSHAWQALLQPARTALAHQNASQHNQVLKKDPRARRSRPEALCTCFLGGVDAHTICKPRGKGGAGHIRMVGKAQPGTTACASCASYPDSGACLPASWGSCPASAAVAASATTAATAAAAVATPLAVAAGAPILATVAVTKSPCVGPLAARPRSYCRTAMGCPGALLLSAPFVMMALVAAGTLNCGVQGGQEP